jgi:hypothetical protein
VGVRFVPAMPGVIAEELRSLVSDPAALAAAGEAVLNHARQAFAWDQAAHRHELLYQELLASTRAERLEPSADAAAANGDQAAVAAERPAAG